MTFAHLPAQTPWPGPRTPGAETPHSVAWHLSARLFASSRSPVSRLSLRNSTQRDFAGRSFLRLADDDTGPPRVEPVPGLVHGRPKSQPYCARCGAFLDGWPFLDSDLCGKCGEKKSPSLI